MACTTDADCTKTDGFGGELMGKCTTTSAGQTCDFDQCTTDASCTDPSDVCSCEGQTSGEGNFGSLCIPANCHTDADCGSSGFCSPSGMTGCGNGFGGTTGWYCHTCADTCVDDSDCASMGMQGACTLDPTVGHWACSYGNCTG
jgi:hypothetical protein